MIEPNHVSILVGKKEAKWQRVTETNMEQLEQTGVLT
jgi:hypothetical protein